MAANDSQKFPTPGPDNAPTGPTGSPRQLSAQETALIKGGDQGWFYLKVTYTDPGKPTAEGYLSQYTAGAMYWDSYMIITPSPRTKFQVQNSGAWLSDVKDVTYKNPPFYLCVTAGPRYWVYLSNYYTSMKWWINGGQLFNDYAGGAAGFDPQDPPFYNRQLWACYGSSTSQLLSNCTQISA